MMEKSSRHARPRVFRCGGIRFSVPHPCLFVSFLLCHLSLQMVKVEKNVGSV